MSKKLIAVLAVLLMIATPLAVFVCTETEATEEVPLDLDTIKDKTDYWVKATFDVDNKKVTLSNNPDKTDGDALTLHTTTTEIEKVVIDSTFTIPEGKEIICENDNDGNLPLDVDHAFKIKGTISGNVYVTTTDNITFEGARVGNENACTIHMIDKTTLIFTKDTVIKEMKTEYYKSAQSNITEISPGLSIVNAKTDKFNLKVFGGIPSDYCQWHMSGNLTGVGLIASIEFGYEEDKTLYSDWGTSIKNSYLLNDMDFHNLDMIVDYDRTKNIIIEDDDDIIDYSDNRFICNDPDVFNLMRSLNAGSVKKLIFDYYESQSIIDEGTIVFAAIDNTGLAAYFGINAVATEGIKSIENPIRFVSMDDNVIDLTKINVTCEDGYKFLGWYYMDSNGVMCKIQNPAAFPVIQNMSVYAVAEKVIPDVPTPTTPEQKDYTPYFIALIVLMVLVILAIGASHFVKYKKNQ